MKQVLRSLNDMSRNLVSLTDRMDKFRKRMNEKDPITGKTRYGPSTFARVGKMLDCYASLSMSIDICFTNEKKGLVLMLQEFCSAEEKKREEEKQKTEAQIQLAFKSKLMDEKIAAGNKIEAEMKEKAKLEADKAEVARLAEEARRQKMVIVEIERQEQDKQRVADLNFMNSVEKGEVGVKKQLAVLREESDDSKAHMQAITSLHTIFSQISSHPEEIKFRKIRRDHSKFQEDISRHQGGRELIIPFGFHLTEVDGVTCFFWQRSEHQK
mmetsp:Transcript_5905/g.7233  ORF Transcript_5905/g.7233 Transcript_5905/m.7233 type:complete len:269 (-) Transcript_5905:64-870(-)